MLVDPDFMDHWKTRMLVGLLDGDEAAPVYILRIWAHCQNRRQATFDPLPPEALKGLCRYPGDAAKLDRALVASGYLRREGEAVEVLGWAEKNAGLLASWTNGHKGGRPPLAKPPRKPTGKPAGKPTGSRRDETREDETREDETPLTEVSSSVVFDQKCFDWEEVRHRAQREAQKLGVLPKSAADRKLMLGACALVLAGTIPEDWLADAVEAVRRTKDVEKPWALFRSCLANKASDRGRDLAALLRAAQIPAELLEPKRKD